MKLSLWKIDPTWPTERAWPKGEMEIANEYSLCISQYRPSDILQTLIRQKVQTFLLLMWGNPWSVNAQGAQGPLGFLTRLNVDSSTNLEQVSVFGSEFLDLEIVLDVGLAADDAAVEEQRLLKPSTSTYRQIN